MTETTVLSPALAVPAEKAGRRYWPELDVIRFTAFLMVFLHHILRPTPDSYAKFPPWVGRVWIAVSDAFGFGLPLFFFLSAFLIGTIFLTEQERYGTIELPWFYIRRILRIWPLYFFGLGIGLIVAIMQHSTDALHMLGYFATVFFGNQYFQSHPYTDNPAAPLWSLSIEEQFYLIFPFALLLWCRYARSRSAWIIGLIFVLISLIALVREGNSHLPIDTTIWTGSLSQLIFFGCGIACAALIYGREIQLRLETRWIAILASAILFLASAAFTDAKRIDAATSGLSVAGGYALVAAGCMCFFFGLFNSKISWPSWLLDLGKTSYGLYVYHVLVLSGATWISEQSIGGHMIRHGLLLHLLSIFPLIVIARISYNYLELPALRLKERFARVSTRPV